MGTSCFPLIYNAQANSSLAHPASIYHSLILLVSFSAFLPAFYVYKCKQFLLQTMLSIPHYVENSSNYNIAQNFTVTDPEAFCCVHPVFFFSCYTFMHSFNLVCCTIVCNNNP